MMEGYTKTLHLKEYGNMEIRLKPRPSSLDERGDILLDLPPGSVQFAKMWTVTASPPSSVMAGGDELIAAES